MGFLKEKARGLWWGRGGVSLLSFWAGASGVQDVSQDNRLGEGRAVPWYGRVGLTTCSRGWRQVSIVRGGTDFRLSRGLPRHVETTESQAVQRVGNRPDGVVSSLGVWGTGLTLSQT